MAEVKDITCKNNGAFTSTNKDLNLEIEASTADVQDIFSVISTFIDNHEGENLN